MILRRIGSWLLLSVLMLGTAYYLWLWPGGTEAVFAPARGEGRTLVLDAGHGGEDGGAVSPSGAVESGINLSIVCKLDQLLGFYGQSPLLLRSEDVSLHDADADTLREKKVSDLHNRAARIEDTENAVLLSVHQNTYPDSRYRGAQVFYAGGEESQSFAVPFQQTGSKRYSQQDALDNGTLFPGLNLPFRVKPEAVKVLGGALAELQALEFVLAELGLYLDTHQGDAEAFALYQQYAAMEREAREKYEAANGPVTQMSAADAKSWAAWLCDPWPWNFQEGGTK